MTMLTLAEVRFLQGVIRIPCRGLTRWGAARDDVQLECK